jgi:hypothetical protein
MAQRTYPQAIHERANLYLHCMMEIKERLAVVRHMEESKLRRLFINEICSVQFRHICELIAIGCLAAQGDFKTQRAFREAYSPLGIFDALRKLYPGFFPQPTLRSYSNGEHRLTANKRPVIYAEQQVRALWSKSGVDLHRASVDKYLRRAFAHMRPLSDIAKHYHGLQALLESHAIPIHSDGDKVLLDVCLDDGGGRVVANFLTIDDLANTMFVESFASELSPE